MSWVWAVLAALAVLFSGSVLYALVSGFLSPPHARPEGAAPHFVSRSRLFAASLLFILPVVTFIKLSPDFPEKSSWDTFFTVLAFLAAAFLAVDLSAEIFVRQSLSRRPAVGAPGILIDVSRGILYLVALIVVLHAYLNIDLRPIFTESAIATVVLGLAFQDTLGNVISGLALHFSSPYKPGDWIRVGDLEGKILHTEWRSTQILTRSNDAIIIPHVVMAKNQIYNFSVPSPVHARELDIPVDYAMPPERAVDTILEVASGVPGILQNPAPYVYIKEFSPTRAVYTLWAWVDDFEHLPEILTEASRRLWYAFSRAGYPLRSTHQYEVAMRPPEIHRDAEERAEFLAALPWFKSLDSHALKALASQTAKLVYGDGESIIRQGDPSRDFYLLSKGKAEVSKDGSVFSNIKPGDFFGEMALLTGEPRKATVAALGEAEVLVFEKKALAPLLQTHPQFLQALSEAVAERLKTLPADLIPVDETDAMKEPESLPKLIVRRIKEFFFAGN